MLDAITTENLSPAESWAARIRSAYARTVQAILDIGRELSAAKAGVLHGEFERMLRRKLRFDELQAPCCTAVARCSRLTDHEVMRNLSIGDEQT